MCRLVRKSRKSTGIFSKLGTLKYIFKNIHILCQYFTCIEMNKQRKILIFLKIQHAADVL